MFPLLIPPCCLHNAQNGVKLAYFFPNLSQELPTHLNYLLPNLPRLVASIIFFE